MTLSGSGSNNNDWNAGGAAAQGSVGYLLSDSVELSLRQLLMMDNSPGAATTWNGASRAALDIHIPLGPLVPFVGGNFGAIYGESVTDSLTAAPEAGIKFFLKSDAYLLAMVEYELNFDKFTDIDDGWRNGAFVYTVGFGLKF